MNGWVSIYDGFPVIGEIVLLLVVARSGKAFCEVTPFAGQDDYGVWWGSHGYRCNYDEETMFWQSLPPLPEGITLDD